MRLRRGRYVRVVVRLPFDVLDSLELFEMPIGIFVRHRIALMLSNLGVIMYVFRACTKVEDCSFPQRKSVGIYLHEREYRVLMWHVKNINRYLNKHKYKPVSVNQALYFLLGGVCHAGKDF